jgi:formylglycine-generating enzyme required for sulfatase activity
MKACCINTAFAFFLFFNCPTRAQEPHVFANSIGIRMVLIPAGSFTMGSPPTETGRQPDETLHEVRITKQFYLSECEITQSEYMKVMRNNPSEFQDDRVDDYDTRHFPVETVSWHEAMDFCEQLSNLPEEKSARRLYRLPTEAEWEYACRAGSQAAYHFGDDPKLLSTHGYFGTQTQPVGEKQPNPWGLYDMHGNVGEWCLDRYEEYVPEQGIDPVITQNRTSVYRVFRGGGVALSFEQARSASRMRARPAARSKLIGLRIAVTHLDQDQ